jgi:hypothetical protein
MAQHHKEMTIINLHTQLPMKHGPGFTQLPTKHVPVIFESVTI